MKKKYYWIAGIVIVIIFVYFLYWSTTIDVISTDELCKQAGGTVKTQLCCKPINDFPDTVCTPVCSCSPEKSKEVKVCDCGEGRCWNSYKIKCSSNCECGMADVVTQFDIEEAKYYKEYVNVTIKNKGTTIIDMKKLEIYIDEILANYTATPFDKLYVGEIATFIITNTTPVCPNKILKIRLESGLEDLKIINCP